MLMRLILGRLSFTSFALGAGAAAFGGQIVKPILASAVKAGLDVKDMAVQDYTDAKTEATAARDAGAGAPDANVAESLASIRAELKSIRADMASGKPARA